MDDYLTYDSFAFPELYIPEQLMSIGEAAETLASKESVVRARNPAIPNNPNRRRTQLPIDAEVLSEISTAYGNKAAMKLAAQSNAQLGV